MRCRTMSSKQMVITMPKKPIRRKRIIKPVEVITPPAASKNVMGLGGNAMILLTNYQAEIKQSLSILFGFIK